MAWAAVLASVALNAEALELSFAVADETGEIGRGAAAATTLANMPSDYSLMLTGSEDLAGPAVGLSFTVTNRSELTQTFRIAASFLVSGGSLVDAAAAASAGIVLSEGGAGADGGALSSVEASPIFQGLIGVTEITSLFADPYLLQCSSGSGVPCSAVASESSLPASLASGSAGSSIAAVFRFELTAGDTAAGAGSFLVSPAAEAPENQVPEPSLGLLLLFGGSALWRAARRQSRS